MRDPIPPNQEFCARFVYRMRTNLGERARLSDPLRPLWLAGLAELLVTDIHVGSSKPVNNRIHLSRE